MDSNSFHIGLGNNDTETRKKADSDFVLFWNDQAKNLSWFKPWEKTLDWKPPFAKWFVGGILNTCYTTLDVHLEKRSQKPAILWEGENEEKRVLTYRDLWIQVCKFSNVLKSLSIKKGDRITIYLPMIPELPISMLACARIGAIHSVVFSGFSSNSLKDRINDSKSKIVITADGGYRGGAVVKLKDVVDEAIKELEFVENVIVVERAKNKVSINSKDKWWNVLMKDSSSKCEPEKVESTHPLYILYTSGTTGKPKGVLHGTGGYLTYLYSTFKWVFDIKDSDIYFCTADIGWVTGHSYIVYGPLLHGATQVMYEGAPDFPNPSRWWKIIQKYKVTILYTTPTALRMFIRFGESILNSIDLSSLRLLGTVGEPINPEVWRWYFEIIGKKKCPIVDTWWQTETGGIIISPLPGLETVPLKPGSATLPIPGINVAVLDEKGMELPTNTKGYLVIRNPWPGMLLTLWANDEKYKKVYWSKYKNIYDVGDFAIKDNDGYFWILGRADDVLKIAGHRIGTAEVESSTVSHHGVAEAAVCGIPHEIKGEVIIAFVVLKEGIQKNDNLKKEIINSIRTGVGPIATPEQLYFVPKLPKTRSGKIMRRLLKAIAMNEKIGDVSTLEDEAAVSEIQDTIEELKHSIQQNK